MKPIATVPAALRSVDLATGAPDAAHVERSDTCAVPAAAVVGEAVVALAGGGPGVSQVGGDAVGAPPTAPRPAGAPGPPPPGARVLLRAPGGLEEPAGAPAAAEPWG